MPCQLQQHVAVGMFPEFRNNPLDLGPSMAIKDKLLYYSAARAVRQ